MLTNSQSPTRPIKKRFRTAAFEYGMLAVLAAAAMTAGFNVLLGLPR